LRWNERAGKLATIPENYDNIREGIFDLLRTGGRRSVRNVDSIMMASACN
jgi:hypothetical protein